MADVTVIGWIAKGGGRLLHEEEGDFILFDMVEDDRDCHGLENDFGTNPAWFHCCFQMKVGFPEIVGFVPPGFRIDGMNFRGMARIVKIGDESVTLQRNPCLRSEQVIGFVKEGALVKVTGQELLLKGEDGNLMRNIQVRDLGFPEMKPDEEPKIPGVPYVSELHFLFRE